MATQADRLADRSSKASTLGTLVAVDGSATHNYLTSEELTSGRHAMRNLSDLAHHLSTLHGRHPGVADHAAARTANPAARDWLLAAVEGFAVERNFLTRLVVAAGPIPSTPGQAQSESAVNGQRHAIEMLASSDRAGCSIGAAAALIMDWRAFRPLLVTAATKMSVLAPALSLPSDTQTIDIVGTLCDTPAADRAATFGAQQLLGQHRGLWDLLEARQIARGEY